MSEQPYSTEERQAMYEDRWKRAGENAKSVAKSMYPEMDDDRRKEYVGGMEEMFARLSDAPELKIVISGGKRTIELPDAETPVDGMDLDEFVRCMGIEESHRYILTDVDGALMEQMGRDIGRPIKLLDLDSETRGRKAA